MVMFPKIDFGLCYPHLFLFFLRPSFGACAPPSPNLAFIAYNFLRRVRRLAIRVRLSTTQKVCLLGRLYVSFSPPEGKTSSFFNSIVLNCAVESVPTRRTICKFLTKLGEMPSPRTIISIRLKRQRGASSAIK